MPSTFRRKQNRLPLDVYRGEKVYSLTLTCAQRSAVFAEKRLVETCIETLRRCSEKHRFGVLAYCFMPDHLHLLVEGSPGSDVVQFTKNFKQRTGFEHRRMSGEALWQKSYYDHVLRREEDVRKLARYIVGNPVRAGLVKAAADYPYSGSFVWGTAMVEA